jgi:predicted GIY-YIG superfamily endonuclease
MPVKTPHHRVYVIRLRNPRRGDRREAFYVGMTGLPVEERFANHKRGYKSASVVAKYGVELAPEWYEDIPPMPYGEASLTEPALADELRDRGYLVYGPTARTTQPRRARRRPRALRR